MRCSPAEKGKAMKDKLIEIIRSVRYNDNGSTIGNNLQSRFVERIADHLIENGVTVGKDNNVPSKWISVKDRLPEDDSDVLAYLRIGEEGRNYPANYAKGMWFDCIFNTPATENTTHWMPLPEPPKGE